MSPMEIDMRILDPDLNISFIEACLNSGINWGTSIGHFFNIVLQHYIKTRTLKEYGVNDYEKIKRHILRVKNKEPLICRLKGKTVKEFVETDLPFVLNVAKHFQNYDRPYNFQSIEKELEFLEYFTALVGLKVGITTRYNFILRYSKIGYHRLILRNQQIEAKEICNILNAGHMLPYQVLTKKDIEFFEKLFENENEQYIEMKQKYVYDLADWDFQIPIPSSWADDRNAVKDIRKYFFTSIDINAENFEALKADAEKIKAINEMEAAKEREKKERMDKEIARAKEAARFYYGKNCKEVASYSINDIYEASKEAILDKYSWRNN